MLDPLLILNQKLLNKAEYLVFRESQYQISCIKHSFEYKNNTIVT